MNFLSLLICPDCHSDLNRDSEPWVCSTCGEVFPLVKGIPALFPIGSLFSKADIAKTLTGTFYEKKVKENASKRWVRQHLPTISGSMGRSSTKPRIEELLHSLPNHTLGLHIGAGEAPEKMSEWFPNIDWLHSDVEFAYGADIMADVTGLPLPDQSVDLIFAGAVLEHVFNPHQAAAEIQRVLKVGGLAIVDVPFLYPWHGIPYDFTRLTPSGIRAMFLRTETVLLGRRSGCWSGLASQMDSILINAFRSRAMRWAAVLTSRVLFSGIKYLDNFAAAPRHLATASSVQFVGRKTETTRTPREIMAELKTLYGNL